MSTFGDDSIRFRQNDGEIGPLIPVVVLGLNWPPPYFLEIDGVTMERYSMSAITDEQREELTHVFRGAEYRPWRADPSRDGGVQ